MHANVLFSDDHYDISKQEFVTFAYSLFGVKNLFEQSLIINIVGAKLLNFVDDSHNKYLLNVFAI